MMDVDADRRRRWKAYHLAANQAEDALQKASWLGEAPPLPHPRFPEDLRGLTCGARNRSGRPCRRRDLGISGRCKLHGGRSSGPKTPEGIAAARANLALRWKAGLENNQPNSNGEVAD